MTDTDTVNRIMRIRNGMTTDEDAEAIIEREIAALQPHERSSPDIVALADKLAATPLDQTHSEWPTIAPVRLSETERELAVNVLRSYARSSAGSVEQVARAMQGANAIRAMRRIPWDDCPDIEREHWLFLAEAALTFITAQPSRDRIYEIVLKELETKHPIPTTVLLATRIANVLTMSSTEHK